MGWRIERNDEVVAFFLVDRATLPPPPTGFSFVRAADDPRASNRPDGVDDLVVTMLEITAQDRFVVGDASRSPSTSALWAAELAPTGEPGADLDGALGAQVFLSVWVPDAGFASHMRSLGHVAAVGSVALSGLDGSLTADDLTVTCTADPLGEPLPTALEGSVLVFDPSGGPPMRIVGANPTHQELDAEWTLAGAHPLGSAIRVGPSYHTAYDAPLVASRTQG